MAYERYSSNSSSKSSSSDSPSLFISIPSSKSSLFNLVLTFFFTGVYGFFSAELYLEDGAFSGLDIMDFCFSALGYFVGLICMFSSFISFKSFVSSSSYSEWSGSVSKFRLSKVGDYLSTFSLSTFLEILNDSFFTKRILLEFWTAFWSDFFKLDFEVSWRTMLTEFWPLEVPWESYFLGVKFYKEIC